MRDAADADVAERAGWSATHSSHDPSADACAVLVNVSDDCTGAFGASHGSLPPWRAVLEVSRHGKPVPLDGEELASLIWLIVDAIRAARQELGPFISVHLFLAAPAGLAVLLGGLLATLPKVVTYDYDTATTMYRPAAEIRP